MRGLRLFHQDNPMTIALKRRWFTYSLRTLFVVANASGSQRGEQLAAVGRMS
jgi:hypothetical protein